MCELSIEAIGADHGDDAILSALTSLGPPARPQPLFLVRSGVPPDPGWERLAGFARDAGWVGDDLGIRRVDELGGMANFDLLSFAVPDDLGATVLICDEPGDRPDPVLDRRPATAVALRVCRGTGPLRLVDCDDACTRPIPRMSDWRYSGARTGEAWLAMCTALAAGRIGDGERILLHISDDGVDGQRESWLALAATDVASLGLAGPRPRKLVA